MKSAVKRENTVAANVSAIRASRALSANAIIKAPMSIRENASQLIALSTFPNATDEAFVVALVCVVVNRFQVI